MTVRPASVSFRLYMGADFSEPVTLKDSNGDPIDLTGASARLQARRDISDTLTTLDLNSATGGIVLGGIAGTVQLVVNGATTAALPNIDWDGEVWCHDLLLTFQDGTKQRTYQGAIIVSPAVTRP